MTAIVKSIPRPGFKLEQIKRLVTDANKDRDETEGDIEYTALHNFLDEVDAVLNPVDPEEEPRFWVTELELGQVGSGLYGVDTVGIVDEEQGGIVAYSHRSNALTIVAAMDKVLDSK